MRVDVATPRRAHDGVRRHTESKEPRIAASCVGYQAVSPYVGYAESSRRLRTWSGCLDAYTWVKNVPYESPYTSTLPRPSAVTTAARSSAESAVP